MIIIATRYRNKQMILRMSETEYKSYLSKLSASHLGQNEFILRCINDKNIIVLEDLKDVLYLLRKTSANVNQVAKGLNTHHGLNVTNDVLQIKNEISQINQSIQSALKVVNT